MSSKVEATATHTFAASAERVFDAWLNPELVKLWMKASLQSHGLAGEITAVEIDPRVGGKFLFADLRDGSEARHWGTYLEIERPTKIVFSWLVDASDEADPSIVTINLQPAGSGCVATIVHTMEVKWIEYLTRTAAGWSRMCTHIDALLTLSSTP